MADSGKVIGIDLGTTNSVVAVMEGGQPVVIACFLAAKMTLAVLAARKQAATNNTAFAAQLRYETMFSPRAVPTLRGPYEAAEYNARSPPLNVDPSRFRGVRGPCRGDLSTARERNLWTPGAAGVFPAGAGK